MTIPCDTSTGVSRPYVLEQFRCAAFDSLHCLSHKNSSLLVTFGLISIKMFVTGPEPVYSVSDPKFTDIPGHPWVHSRHQTVDLTMFI